MVRILESVLLGERIDLLVMVRLGEALLERCLQNIIVLRGGFFLF